MGAVDTLQELMRRIGLEQAEISERGRLLEWGQDDARRLNENAARMAAAQAAFIERLYRHLDDFPAPAALLGDAGTVHRLKQRQLEYYERLWQGPYDRDYIDNRLRIGLIHHINGVELKWYLAAYRLYLEQMLAPLCGQGADVQLFSSLLKAVFFDMTLAIDTYSAAQRKALEDSEARFARALRGAHDGIWDWHPGADTLYVSERWADMIGLERQALGQTSDAWFSRVHPDDLPGLHQAINAHLHGESDWIHHEYRIRCRNGDWLWVLSRGVAEADRDGQLRITGSQSDISRRKAVEHQLHHAARHDPLTGLANRLRLDELLLHTQRQLHDTGSGQAAVLFIDLDRFKLINDSFGHLFGDGVLVEVGRRLAQCLRAADHLFRFGGDEFVVLLVDPGSAGCAEQVAQRILGHLHQPMRVDDRTLVVNASIGIATLHASADLNDALQAADLALHQAKQAGKAQFAHYSAGLQASAQRQLELESALGQALARGEFVLHYQPIHRLDAHDPPMAGVEALLRWRHDGRLVPPLEFIPSLEESGEIVQVGDWVLREACRQTRAWQLAGHRHLYCSVNLSRRQLQQDDFVARVVAILDDTGLPAASLVLEITETHLMQDSNATLGAALRRLAALGVRLALDDFGTGYSSLGYLKRFPLHMLKIDKSFIAGLPGDAELGVISRAIIGLGHSLGLEVVAEGVEHARHLEFLRTEGCPLAQGYGFSPPCPAAVLERLLEGGAAPLPPLAPPAAVLGASAAAG
ncbi:EAL domain-containing protein [Stenotrophomonas acidaminiphila]|uniref:putative bifunctional diguanylate cyclase/phosphodiesterase n=1 Tax=Stenotrophomonas acidaminiphila TaxID=128780 RepID=UPI0028A6F6F3|nr:EAL domain-containing protein [Stenotrophomonas acidaminiphila]